MLDRSPGRGLPRSLVLPLVFALVAGAADALGPQRREDGGPPRIAVDGGARKICQLTGEIDRERGQPTVNRTESRFGFWGTDLGASFEHRGRLHFLFGDTHPVGGLDRPADADLMAVTDDVDPERCLRLSFPREADGGYRPLVVPGVALGRFGVPTGGFSAAGRIHVFLTTDFTPQNPMGRAVLASSEDDGLTFAYGYDVSTTHFINIAPAVVRNADIAGLPETAGDGVLLWASGRYRRSDPRLAYLPADRAGDRDALRYFEGLDGSTGRPIWSEREADSVALFRQGCLGELSVGWNPQLRKWLMLYNCGTGRNTIQLRAADAPWGPWSDPETLFDPGRDGGFCGFMHAGPAPSGAGCPAVSDPHATSVAGDPYGPYLIPKFSAGVDGVSTTIYYAMSTWNPYAVVLMASTLRVERGDGPADPSGLAPPQPLAAAGRSDP